MTVLFWGTKTYNLGHTHVWNTCSLHVLAQTFYWGCDGNILSGSELRKRNLAIEVYLSQWPAQCVYMSDIPDFNRFCWQDRKILRALLDFFSWTAKNFESAANLKMQNEKYTFIFIPNIENMESALPLNEKLKNCGLMKLVCDLKLKLWLYCYFHILRDVSCICSVNIRHTLCDWNINKITIPSIICRFYVLPFYIEK